MSSCTVFGGHYKATWRDLTDNEGNKIDQLKIKYSFLFGTTFESTYDLFGVISLNSDPLLGKFDIKSPSKYLPDETYHLSMGVGFQALILGKPNW